MLIESNIFVKILSVAPCPYEESSFGEDQPQVHWYFFKVWPWSVPNSARQVRLYGTDEEGPCQGRSANHDCSFQLVCELYSLRIYRILLNRCFDSCLEPDLCASRFHLISFPFCSKLTIPVVSGCAFTDSQRNFPWTYFILSRLGLKTNLWLLGKQSFDFSKMLGSFFIPRT